MRELRPGLWHWTAPHPDWTPEEPWGERVSSYAVDDGERLMLFDPLAVPSELEQRASERAPVVVLTAPWHERDAQSLVTRLGARVAAPPRHTAEDLMRLFGITAEQAGEGSPDLLWLADADKIERPPGVEAFPGRDDNDLVLWIDQHKAIIAGDSLADFGNGLEIVPGWLPPDVTRDDVVARLRPLLDLPVELVLPAHGEPTDRAALERALSPSA